jgi:hypothetical protein
MLQHFVDMRLWNVCTGFKRSGGIPEGDTRSSIDQQHGSPSEQERADKPLPSKAKSVVVPIACRLLGQLRSKYRILKNENVLFVLAHTQLLGTMRCFQLREGALMELRKTVDSINRF